MKLSRDFSEFIECLNESKVRYLVVGGYAVAYHGRPRYTKDIDIWLDVSQENGARVVDALEKFGFAALGLTAADFQEPDTIIQLGYEPQRIDLLTSAAGLDFAKAWENQRLVKIDNVTIRFLGLQQLIENKTAVGRPQDLADIEALE
ncbi:MAG: nucleotidyltransferase [Candidatus Eremiobacteraeota bacterium]|nr:nucleotidyltransferase [Candidatus Eremiobacteraeota bacterium]